MCDNYYTIKDFLINYFDKNSRKNGFNAVNVEQYYNWKNETVNILKETIGINKMKRDNFNAKVIDKVSFDDYDRLKIVIQTQKGVLMPMYVLIPIKSKANNVPVIALHGHGSNGKEGIVGIINENINNDTVYALDLVKRGFTVFCPDLCGSGERRELKNQGFDKVLETSCTDLNNVMISMGISLIGFITFDLISLVDYIYTFDNLKLEKLICVGFSGGGLSCLWLAAIDERVKYTVTSGYFHGFRDTILQSNFCGCNFIPNLWTIIDIGDLAAMIAPRNLLIESGKDDELNGSSGIDNVYSQLDIAIKAFKLFNKESNIINIVCDGGHKWYGSCYEYLENWIR